MCATPELDFQEGLIRIAPDIFFNPATNHCYLGFSNRNRTNTYGAHLKEIYELYNSRYTVDKPVVVTNCKHELVLEFITEANARKLADLNLKKDLEHRSNRNITDKWTYPSEKYTNDPDFQEEDLEYPTPPYKPIPLDQVELCDLVTTGEYIKAYYEVTDNLGTHLLARCLYHESLKHREGEEDFWITTPYLVKKG